MFLFRLLSALTSVDLSLCCKMIFHSVHEVIVTIYHYFGISTYCLCSQHHVDPSLGVYIIDRYTYYALEFLERVKPDSKKSMGQFVSAVRSQVLSKKFI